MSKRKKRSARKHTGLFVTLGVLGAVVITGGVLAIVTKGFKNLGPAEKLIKGGTTVLKLDAVDFNENTGAITFKDKSEDYTLTAIADLGYQSEDEEHIYLGDKETDPALADTELQANMLALGLSNKNVSDIVEYATALNVAKVSNLYFDLSVDYAKTRPTGFKEVEYFDAVRINYSIDGKRAIVTDNTEDDEHKASLTKRINTITNLYENVDLYKVEEDETLSQNRISFYTISQSAEKDNSVETLSIEFIRTGKANNDNKCYFAQL